MKNKHCFTLLGTGSSGGVPRVGNQWGRCDAANPKNRRRRCAMLVESIGENGGKTTVLIDAGCDLREQLLSAEVNHLDAVLLTHSHADHIFGLDDLRQLAISMKSSIPVYMDDATAKIVMQCFGYCFHQAAGSSYPAFCEYRKISHDHPVFIEGAGGPVEAMPIVAEHGDIQALGFRFNDLVYLPDVKRITHKPSLQSLEQLDTLILDALRYAPHPSHMNLDDALDLIQQYKPVKSILTNMHSDLDYEELKARLPEHVTPGYDGLVIRQA